MNSDADTINDYIVLDGEIYMREIESSLKVKLSNNLLSVDQEYQWKRRPGIAVIVVGNVYCSQIDLRQKLNLCNDLGFISELFTFASPNVCTEDILKCIDHCNRLDYIDGIFVQMPLPDHLDVSRIWKAINPAKIISKSITSFSIMALLDFYKVPVRGTHIVIISSSEHFDKPVSSEFLLKNCTVSICRRYTDTILLSSLVNMADILIVSIGFCNIIQSEWIKQGATIIDIGMNCLPSGQIVGDIDFETAKYRCRYITKASTGPVPGGVGPVIAATLMTNVFENFVKRH